MQRRRAAVRKAGCQNSRAPSMIQLLTMAQEPRHLKISRILANISVKLVVATRPRTGTYIHMGAKEALPLGGQVHYGIATLISVADVSAVPQRNLPVRIFVGLLRIAPVLPPTRLVVVAVAVTIPPAVSPAASNRLPSRLNLCS